MAANQHELGREIHGAGGAGNGNFALFLLLAHGFMDVALELGEFLQEQRAVVAQGDFAGGADSCCRPGGRRRWPLAVMPFCLLTLKCRKRLNDSYLWISGGPKILNHVGDHTQKRRWVGRKRRLKWAMRKR